MTFIEITPEIKKDLVNKLNLNEEKDKLYLIIIENKIHDLKMVTSNYTYKFVLLNGTELTELNLTQINEDIYAKIIVPLIDFNLSHFDYYQYFSKQGYDIYDKYNIFYHDICSPAHLYDNDIIIKDRKKDIYPNDAIFCKENCYYNGIIIEEKRIICNCNLNVNNKNNDDKKDFLKEEDKDNFFNYLLDNINYKIFICYGLISSFNNLKNNISFYVILFIILINIIFNLVFYFYSISKLKRFLFRDVPTQEKIKIDTLKKLMKQKTINHIKEPIRKKKRKSKTYNFSKNTIIKHSESKMSIYFYNEEKEEDLNELSYEVAKYKDKRNIFNIFKSIFFEKIDLINIYNSKYQLQFILISQYLTLLMLNIFIF